jgi:hypothetical protein
MFSLVVEAKKVDPIDAKSSIEVNIVSWRGVWGGREAG